MQLETTAVLGLAATGLGALIRALPWPEAWKSRKPLSCVACMGGWCSLATLVVAGFAGLWQPPSLLAAGLQWLACTGIAAALLAQTGMFATLTFGD